MDQMDQMMDMLMMMVMDRNPNKIKYSMYPEHSSNVSFGLQNTASLENTSFACHFSRRPARGSGKWCSKRKKKRDEIIQNVRPL
jgi:hypothetical protein